MRILYIALKFPKEKENNNLYTDLAEQLKNAGNDVTVVVTDEIKTKLSEERYLEVLRINTGKIFNVNLITKGINYVMMSYKLKKGIKKYLKNRKYDLILYTAPPITITSVIKYAMKKYNAKSYLMQKDIFPQNALDLGILKKTNPVYWYFKFKERKSYRIASTIGCMSEGNIEYILNNNKYIDRKKVELFPNTITLKEIKQSKYTNDNIRDKYGIKKDSVIALYGGNFGKPQGIDFIIKVIDEYKNRDKITFIFAGEGTEKKRLYKHIEENKIKNVITLDFIPKDEYNDILKETDIGLIFLDYRFTIPNIPSRTLSYFEYSIPIMAATDKNTDYKDILLKQAEAGLWCESNNVEEFRKQFNFLIENKEQRIKMGQNGRRYLEEKLTTEKSVEILENTYYNLKKEGVKNV